MPNPKAELSIHLLKLTSNTTISDLSFEVSLRLGVLVATRFVFERSCQRRDARLRSLRDDCEDGSPAQRPSRRRGALGRNQRALEGETKLRLELTVQVRFSVDGTEGGAGDRQCGGVWLRMIEYVPCVQAELQRLRLADPERFL